MRSITRKEAADLYAGMFSPGAVTFLSVGPQPLAELVQTLERHFGDWQPEAEALPRVVREPASFPPDTRVLLVPEPGASQSAIHIARPAPGFDEPGHAEAIATFRLLGFDFLSRLNSVIREEKGYSYGTDGELVEAVRKGSVMVIETTVERANTGAALSDMFAGFASLAAEPVREDELQRTVTAYYALIAGAGETAAGLFEEVWGQLGRGSSLEEEHGRRVAVTQLQLEAVRGQAAAMASLDNAVVVIVGDPDVVLPQLEAIGLDAEIVARETP